VSTVSAITARVKATIASVMRADADVPRKVRRRGRGLSLLAVVALVVAGVSITVGML